MDDGAKRRIFSVYRIFAGNGYRIAGTAKTLKNENIAVLAPSVFVCFTWEDTKRGAVMRSMGDGADGHGAREYSDDLIKICHIGKSKEIPALAVIGDASAGILRRGLFVSDFNYFPLAGNRDGISQPFLDKRDIIGGFRVALVTFPAHGIRAVSSPVSLVHRHEQDAGNGHMRESIAHDIGGGVVAVDYVQDIGNNHNVIPIAGKRVGVHVVGQIVFVARGNFKPVIFPHKIGGKFGVFARAVIEDGARGNSHFRQSGSGLAERRGTDDGGNLLQGRARAGSGLGGVVHDVFGFHCS